MGNRDGDKAVYAKINTGRLGWNRALAWTQVEVKATDGVQPGQSETLINCTVYQAFNAVEGPPRFVFSLFMFAFCPMDLGFLIVTISCVGTMHNAALWILAHSHPGADLKIRSICKKDFL
jgi:hypothetical protein